MHTYVHDVTQHKGRDFFSKTWFLLEFTCDVINVWPLNVDSFVCAMHPQGDPRDVLYGRSLEADIVCVVNLIYVYLFDLKVSLKTFSWNLIKKRVPFFW